MAKLERQWTILLEIPTFPRTISLNRVNFKLGQIGYRCSRRTLERDVSALETSFSGVLLVLPRGEGEDRSQRLAFRDLRETAMPAILKLIKNQKC